MENYKEEKPNGKEIDYEGSVLRAGSRNDAVCLCRLRCRVPGSACHGPLPKPGGHPAPLGPGPALRAPNERRPAPIPAPPMAQSRGAVQGLGKTVVFS